MLEFQTLSQIADFEGVPKHRLEYIVGRLRPRVAFRAGSADVYGAESVAAIVAELHRIDAWRDAVRAVGAAPAEPSSVPAIAAAK
jgi:hypothetical protein